MSPWVRLDEKALDHPKITGLPDGAFRLWIEALTHCQRHLTDGRVISSALKGLRAYSPKRRDILIGSALWDTAPDGGIQVHDYLQWNESREDILKARDDAKHRRRRYNERNASETTGRNASPDASSNASPDGDGTANVPSVVLCSDPPKRDFSISKRGESAREGKPNARSGRVIFSGRRFTVHEFMFDDLRKLLGEHTDSFDLHAWFFSLDEKANAEGLIVPQRDGGKWLQEQTMGEAQRRGLFVDIPSARGKTAGNAAVGARFIARGGVQ